VFEASHRIFGPVTHSDGHHHDHNPHVVWVGAGGLLVNAMGLWLIAPLMGKKDDVSAHRINIESVFIHALVDVASSAIVIASSLVQRFVVAPWADPLSAMAIALLTLRAAAPIFQKTARILAQATPAGFSPDAALREIAAEPGVLETTSAHFWCLAPGHNVGSIGIRIRNDADRQRIVDAAHRLFASTVQNLTVECERESAAHWIAPSSAPPPDAQGALLPLGAGEADLRAAVVL